MYFKCKLLAQNGCADTLNNLLEAFIKRGAEDVEEIQFLLEFIFEAHSKYIIFTRLYLYAFFYIC